MTPKLHPGAAHSDDRYLNQVSACFCSSMTRRIGHSAFSNRRSGICVMPPAPLLVMSTALDLVLFINDLPPYFLSWLFLLRLQLEELQNAVAPSGKLRGR